MFPLLLDPIAFTVGALTVHWYGMILALGALAGLLLAIQEGKRFGLTPDFFFDLLLYGLPSSIIGARIYYVAFKIISRKPYKYGMAVSRSMGH
jgi:phosphatidylglycerol:prolipoprotein diacylglycerol transferase